jgi:hypothetical protein
MTSSLCKLEEKEKKKGEGDKNRKGVKDRERERKRRKGAFNCLFLKGNYSHHEEGPHSHDFIEPQ